MPPPIERQTLIALKARRTAFRVVSDFLHFGKLKRSEIACERCGAALYDAAPDPTQHLCQRCVQWEITSHLNAALEQAYMEKHRQAFPCPTCGYDLRATPQRCPECGTVP